jgi:hypothetical protein
MAGKALFVVRAVVANEADRAAFDRWYEEEHLPDAVRSFKALRAWRCWSRTDPSVHYAFYEMASVADAEAIPRSPEMTRLVADFDRAWRGIPRTREVLEIAAGA